MAGKKVAAYCMTRNLYDIAVVSIKSLLINSNVDTIYLLLEDDIYPYDLPKIKVINVKDQKIFDPNGPNYNCQWSYMTLMRLALFKILKENKVLSLDIDTIVDGNINHLWEVPMDDYYVMGGREPFKSKKHLYINVGVVMQNLKKLRDGTGDKLIEIANSTYYPWPDQDIMNVVCQDHILEFEPQYNSHPWNDDPALKVKPVIKHFATVKNWANSPLYDKYDKITEIKGEKVMARAKVKKPAKLVETRGSFIKVYKEPSLSSEVVKSIGYGIQLEYDPAFESDMWVKTKDGYIIKLFVKVL